MKSFKNILATAAIGLLILTASCTKQGPVGPAGTNGTNGTNGSNGNANVKEFFYSNQGDFSALSKYLQIKSSVFDSSLVLVYYDPSNGVWYSCPGLGSGANYQTRFYTNGAVDSVLLSFGIYNPDGSAYTGTAVTVARLKVIVAPASSVFVGKTSPVDFNDYRATMKYFGLKE